MTNPGTSSAGRCMCGAVRYETTGKPVQVINCHCHSCRKHTGAPAATLAVYNVGQVQFSGDDRKIYESSWGVGRSFCSHCGTSLTWETELDGYGSICAIHISAFDDPDALVPSAHSFYPERLSWFDFADDLPRYEGFVVESVLLCHGPVKEKPKGP